MPIEVPYLPADQNLDPLTQDWGETYKELCALIRAKVPAIKHVDLYYGQEQFIGGDGNWMPFRAPAVGCAWICMLQEGFGKMCVTHWVLRGAVWVTTAQAPPAGTSRTSAGS